MYVAIFVREADCPSLVFAAPGADQAAGLHELLVSLKKKKGLHMWSPEKGKCSSSKITLAQSADKGP